MTLVRTGIFRNAMKRCPIVPPSVYLIPTTKQKISKLKIHQRNRKARFKLLGYLGKIPHKIEIILSTALSRYNETYRYLTY